MPSSNYKDVHPSTVDKVVSVLLNTFKNGVYVCYQAAMTKWKNTKHLADYGYSNIKCYPHCHVFILKQISLL